MYVAPSPHSHPTPLAGEMKGKIIVDDKEVSWEVPELKHPVSEVSCKKPYTVGKGDVRIVAVDTGMKDSMLRCLVARGASVKVPLGSSALSFSYLLPLFLRVFH